MRRRLLAALLASSTAFAAEPWQTLPPTPPLPKPAVAGSIHVNDIDMWRAEFGPSGGKPVILLHGGLANSNYFGHLIPALTEAGFHVIAIDSRGHGRSTRSAQPFSYELMELDVVAMLDALHIARADLVGWSDGGIIGIVMAIRHPERLRRVFAFGANTDPSGLRPNIDGPGSLFEQYEQRAAREYRQLSPTPTQFAPFRRQIDAMWATQPRIDAATLRTIDVPVTIADGAHDEAIEQSHSRYLAETIPHARLVILPTVSHFAMLQDPPLFARTVLDALRP